MTEFSLAFKGHLASPAAQRIPSISTDVFVERRVFSITTTMDSNLLITSESRKSHLFLRSAVFNKSRPKNTNLETYQIDMITKNEVLTNKNCGCND